MVEIASLLLAIAGGVDITTRTSSELRRIVHEWKDAPDQVASLSEEIINSRRVALQLKEFCEKLELDSLDAVYAATIHSQIRRAEPLWVHLEKIVQSIRAPTGRLRKERWIKNVHKVAVLQEKLRLLRFATVEIPSIYVT